MLLALAGALVLAACGNTSSATPTAGGTIRIGYVASLTGAAASDARADVTGAQFAVDEINSAGGVNGSKLQLLVRDDQSSPTTASTLARTLVLSDKVQFLAGSELSGVAASVSAVSKELKVPYIISTATSTAITEENGHRYVFRSWANVRSQIGPAASYAAKQPWKKYAVIYADYTLGKQIDTLFQQYVKKDNPSADFALNIPAKLGETEYTTQINQVLAAKPDAIYLAGIFGASVDSFAKQAAAAGLYNQAPVIAFTGAADLAAFAKIVPDGKQIGYNSFFSTIPMPFAKTFADKYYNATGVVADGSAFTGYTTVKWIESGVKKAGGSDPEKFVDALAGSTLDTFLGPVTMRKIDHQATGDYWYGYVQQGTPPVMTNLGHASGASYQLTDAEITALRSK